MSYLVLARKFRPLNFSQVAGQEHVTRTLANSIKRLRIAHAYLFSGPRGVGKTSIARIFAKSLNCEDGPTDQPCLKCSNCLEIAASNNLAVLEIDGASHNSVDNVRELIDTFRSMPAPGSRYKIYIIDEVHMLSGAAFNALLKSLEEPPPHTVFILATTEAHKIPDTVISRCQRHDFRVLDNEVIETQLNLIAEKENIEIEREAVRMIARLSDGSMRDAESLLERIWAFCEGRISAAETSQVLGTVERTVLFEISAAIFARQANLVLELLSKAFSTGLDPILFVKEFVSHWREILIAKFAGKAGLENFGLEKSDINELLQQVSKVDSVRVQELAQLARQGGDSALWSRYPKYSLEALLVRMASIDDLPKQEIAKEKIKSDAQTVNIAPELKKTSTRQVEGKPSDSMPLGQSTGKHLSWNLFVQHLDSSGSKMLAEHLKRLALVEFLPGRMYARGPEFSVLYLKRKENITKLTEVLQQYSKQQNWEIKFELGAQEEGSSLHQTEQRAKVEVVKQKKESIANHPKIESLLKAFPGSKIEDIKIKS